MRVALDTKQYVNFCRGDETILRVVKHAHEIVLPFVVVAELRAGFACGTKAKRNASILTRFLGKPRVRVVFADDTTTHHYANLFKQLRQQGTPVPTNDLWIAACALRHDRPLVTRNIDEFRRVPDLRVLEY